MTSRTGGQLIDREIRGDDIVAAHGQVERGGALPPCTVKVPSETLAWSAVPILDEWAGPFVVVDVTALWQR